VDNLSPSGGTLAVKVGAAIVNNIVDVKTSEKAGEGITTTVDINPSNVIKNAAIDLTVDGLAGDAASKLTKKVGSNTSTVLSNSPKSTSPNKTKVTKSESTNNKTKMSEKTTETVVKGAAAGTKENVQVKEKTNFKPIRL
jgi:thiamine pyrophosphate-dependent acetolactate synthase large subunit-like protein